MIYTYIWRKVKWGGGKGDGEAREGGGGEGTSGKWRGRGEGGQERVPRGEEGNGEKYSIL